MLELFANKQYTPIFESVLDVYLMKKAKNDRKLVSSAETIDEHCFQQPNYTIVSISNTNALNVPLSPFI